VLKFYYLSIICVRPTSRKGRTRSQIREAQKHPDPVPDRGPQHCLELLSFFSVYFYHHLHVVSDIPTELIASFSATLEDALQADIILHVRKVTRLTLQQFYDPDPDWIRIQSDHWSRILNPDPDPGGQK
jgi:hypothetical protein